MDAHPRLTWFLVTLALVLLTAGGGAWVLVRDWSWPRTGMAAGTSPSVESFAATIARDCRDCRVSVSFAGRNRTAHLRIRGSAGVTCFDIDVTRLRRDERSGWQGVRRRACG